MKSLILAMLLHSTPVFANDALNVQIMQNCKGEMTCVQQESAAAMQLAALAASGKTNKEVAKACAFRFVIANGKEMATLFRFMHACAK